MKKSYLIFAAIGLIVLVAILTNPNEDKHKEVMKSKANSYMQKYIKGSLTETDSEQEQAGQGLGMMLGGVLVDRIIDNIVSVNNYILFSTTEISWDGQTKVIGVGAFGNVYVTSKLDEAMNEGLLKNKLTTP